MATLSTLSTRLGTRVLIVTQTDPLFTGKPGYFNYLLARHQYI